MFKLLKNRLEKMYLPEYNCIIKNTGAAEPPGNCRYVPEREVFMKKRMLAILMTAATAMSMSAIPGTMAFADDLTTVNVVMNTFGSPVTDEGVAATQDAINELIADDGIQINLQMITPDAYAQQINLMISGGEPLDVFSITPGASSFATFSANNSLMDIAPYLDDVGKDLKELIRQEYWDACTLDGQIKMVTTWDDKVTDYWLVMDQALLEKYDLVDKARDIKTITDIEDIYSTVYDGEGGVLPMVATGTINALTPSEIFIKENLADSETYETLGDQAYQMGILKQGSDTFENLYATDEWKANVERMTQWYQNGWVYKDSPTTTETGENLLKNGAIFSFFTAAEMNCETQKTKQCGKPVVAAKIANVPVSGGRIRQFGYGVSSTSQNPEAAVKWLNILYTNEEVANLLNYGVEGKDWEDKGDGTIGYPDGVDASNVAYNLNLPFVVGNSYILKVWQGESPTLRDDAWAVNKDAKVSEYASYSWNSSAVTDEVTATTNVYNEYYKTLTAGASTDYEADIEAFNEKLEAAGLDAIIADKQAQFDAYNK